MLGRQVDHDQAVDAGVFGFGNKARHAVFVDWVEVAHQHQRGHLLAFAELTNHLQGFRQVLTVVQGANIGQLDRRTIGHWIGEGHTQLNHIRAGGRQTLEDGQRGVVVRVATGDEGHQGRAVLLFQLGKAALQAAHACFSCCSMWCTMVCMSLSPRPERLITIR